MYKSEQFEKAQAAKKEIDGVLDNLKGLVNHVVQREEMKIRQHTNPRLNQARLKIVSQEAKVRELQQMDTSEHADLRGLIGDIRAYDMMMGQLRQKMGQVDFLKHRERLFSEKLGLINQHKRDDTQLLNKENMQLSYEIDELMDRINEIKKKREENKSFFVTDEEFGPKKDASRASAKKLSKGG